MCSWGNPWVFRERAPHFCQLCLLMNFFFIFHLYQSMHVCKHVVKYWANTSSNRRGIAKESQVGLKVPQGPRNQGNFWFIEVLTHLKSMKICTYRGKAKYKSYISSETPFIMLILLHKLETFIQFILIA